MTPWTKLELSVINGLLEELGDRFSNDGCNDLSDEQLTLADVINLDINEEDDQIRSNNDLVTYFQQKLKNISTKAEVATSSQTAEIRLMKKESNDLNYDNKQLQGRIHELEKLEYVKDLVKKIQEIKL